MYKKYKFKRKKKILKVSHIFFIFLILTLSMSFGYAYFSDSLSVRVKVNVSQEEGDGDEGSDEEVVPGSSTYNAVIASMWGSPDGGYTYNFQITIVNMDQDFTGTPQIELKFDLVEGLVLDESSQCNIWQAESVTQSGKTVTIIFEESASWLSLGSTLTLYPHFVFAEEHPDLTLTNLIINGKAAQLDTSL